VAVSILSPEMANAAALAATLALIAPWVRVVAEPPSEAVQEAPGGSPDD
jgi:hypothetical protein